MKPYVIYKDLTATKKLLENMEEGEDESSALRKIRTQLTNDISYGSGSSSYEAVKELFQGQANWEEYRPTNRIVGSDPHSFKVTFKEDFFDFSLEGVNHFIGTVAGDVLLNKDIESIIVDDFGFDCSEKEDICNVFPGPNYGIDGVYNLFGNPERPLLAYSIKPRMGYNPTQFAKIFEAAACGGADIVEDDERMISPVYCPVMQRIEIAGDLQKRYKNTFYSANVSGTLDNMMKWIKHANDNGIKFVKIDVMVTGFDALRCASELIKQKGYDIRITVYPDAVNKYRGLSRNFVLKMARLCGADVIYAGSPRWSRNDDFSADLFTECQKINNRHLMLEDQKGYWSTIKPTLSTLSNDISDQSAEVITWLFKHCFSREKFAFFIGHTISSSSLSIEKETRNIQDRIKKAADSKKDELYIVDKREKHVEGIEDYDNLNLSSFFREVM